ncbi:MAG: carbonic anhydrase [Bacteroidetes bacterium]|nr:carbonic anhydrase [Bacteroidota bacterium]
MNEPLLSLKHREHIMKIVEGNEAFYTKHGEEFFLAHCDSQHPFITLVTCSDSRVHSHAILPDPVNAIFVVRNIGNQLHTAAGSVDYGIYHLKTPLLVILGHSDCGAIKDVMKGYYNEPHDIYRELETLPHTIQGSYIDDTNAFTEKLYSNIIKNIHFQVDSAVKKYSNLLKSDDLAILGGFYDFRNECYDNYGKLIWVNINGNADEKRISTDLGFT